MGNSSPNIYDNKKGKIEKAYLKKVKKILTRKNVINYSMINNLKICLSEKNFDQIPESPVQYFTLNAEEEPTNFINWLDFIYQYLYKENSQERYWAAEMMNKLDKETFLYENKYLSEFFLEEFELENFPKCLYLDKKLSVINEKIDFDSSTLNVTQNLGGSFMNSPNNLEDKDIANLKYKHFRDKVKGYINKFKQHIFKKDHPINRVTQIFVELWVKYANVKISSVKKKYTNLENKKNMEEINIFVNDITLELQRFIVHIQISLKLFYSRTINYSYFNEEKDELINLITSLLFRSGEIYNTIFELYKFSLTLEIKKMEQNFLKMKKVTPEELGINKQYCLNLESLNLQEEILNKRKKELEERDNNDDKVDVINDNNDDNDDNDVKFKIKKIEIILDIIKENKKKCPRYGDREMEETTVNLNYEENYDLIPKESNDIDKMDKINEENNLGENIGIRKMSLLPIHELYNESIDIDDNNYLEEKENIISTSFYENKDNLRENKNEIFGPCKTMIIRTSKAKNNEEGKFSNFPKIEKVLNRISFTRTKNIEYLSYPYETAIQLLKQVKKYKTPFEKMMIFASISSEITECINDFWNDLSEYIDKNLLNLEIDQIMTIFIYIIIQSQIEDIGVHCKIIKSFTTCITKASMIGYYYSTVEASVQYISSTNNVEELIKNKIN